MPSIYGTYLCKDPPNQFLSPASDRLEILRRSAEYFSRREQLRAVERLQYEIAQVYMQDKQWVDAIQILLPLWQTLSWRREGWWSLLEEVDWTLRECALHVGDGKTLIAVEWELLSSCLGNRLDRLHQFSNCLDALKLSHPIPKTIIRAENVISCISATFAFALKEGHVGEALPAQLVVSSCAHKGSDPIILSQIKVAFNGGLKDINIQHDLEELPDVVSADGAVHMYDISFPKTPTHDDSVPSSSASLHGSQSLLGSSNLSFPAGITKTLSFVNLPRDAGTVEAVSITLCIKGESFEMDICFSDEQQLWQEMLWVRSVAGPSKKALGKGRSNTVKILSKPPKLRIEIVDLLKPYLTDEIVSLNVQLINEEEGDADVSLEVQLHDQSESAPGINWAFDGEHLQNSKGFGQNWIDQPQSSGLLSTSLGEMSPYSKKTRAVWLQAVRYAAQYGLEVKARYRLLSDPETPISKTLVTNIIFVKPFEVNYDFLPRVLLGPWPNYFAVDDTKDASNTTANDDPKAGGLNQRWFVAARITSFVAEPILIEDVGLHVLDVHDRAICSVRPIINSHEGAILIPPNELQERQFELEVQKIDLEDRRSTVVGLQLEIRWQREDSDRPVTTTTVAVPDLAISFGEPRVLASASKGQGNDGLIHLDYVIENPSMHVLTFKLNMEPNDDFAFSGAKDSLVQLVPLSRHSIRYNLLPLVRGAWINPQFRVMDTHFRKMLRVNAAEGVRADKKGALIWVDAEADS